MPFNERSLAFKIVTAGAVLVFALLLFLIGLSLGRLNASFSDQAHQMSEQCAGHTKQRIESECVEGGRKNYKYVKDVIGASRESQRAEESLVFQEKSERWSFYSFVSSLFAVLVSIGALIALLISLHLTRKAISQTREIGEAQTVAYISLDDIRVKWTGESCFEILVKILNSGQSPAFDVKIFFGAAQGDTAGWVLRTEPCRIGDIGSTDRRARKCGLSDSDRINMDLWKKSNSIKVFGYIEFRTIFSRETKEREFFCRTMTYEASQRKSPNPDAYEKEGFFALQWCNDCDKRESEDFMLQALGDKSLKGKPAS